MPLDHSINSHPIYQDLPRPAVIAHRGASAYAPENTIAAFELALRQGADAIELDVWLTTDDEVVVIHGPDLDRTTGFHGKVSQMSLNQLKILDAGSHFGPEFHREKIPTLSEVFEVLDKNIIINIELKNFTSFSRALPEKVTQMIQKHGYQKQVIISSFNPISILQASRYLPETPTALLALWGRAGAFSRSALAERFHFQALHAYFGDVTPDLVRRLHTGGKRLHAFVVNTKLDIKNMLDQSVDGIITNDPPLARQTIAEYRSIVTHSRSKPEK